MGNAYPTTINQTQCADASPVYDEGDDDAEAGAALASLLEENARLRTLVVQLSDLVLRNVVGRK